MIQFLNDSVAKKYRGKTALLRVDLNIEPGEEKNTIRLEAIVPTVKLLLKNGVKVVLLSHRGRPKATEGKLSLKVFTSILSKKIGRQVEFFPDFDFSAIGKKIGDSKGRVFLLENLRFLSGEDKNDTKLAKDLVRIGDFYVNDAFAFSHRPAASVVALAGLLPAYGGLLLEQEIKNLNRVMTVKKHPFVIVLGGAKISDKIGIVDYFRDKADKFLLAGGPANTFFAVEKLPIGSSLIDEKAFGFVRQLDDFRKIVLPVDVKFSGDKILDIGQETIAEWRDILGGASTVIWNGPAGLFEKKGFEQGTRAIAEAVFKNRKATVVIGGGETTAALNQLLLKKGRKVPKNVFVSTGGGAMLDYLSGKKLPGIEALK
jgi:phosphoglycerate kinase